MLKMVVRQAQEQRQILSQKMIQSNEILQMDTQELSHYIQQQSLENPLIDLEKLEQKISENNENISGSDHQKQDDFQRKLEWLNNMDEQNRVYYSKDMEEDEMYEPWNFAVTDNNLQDYVFSQLILQSKTDQDDKCLEFLAYELDSRGYLTDDRQQLAQKLDIDEPTLKHYIHLLQSVEPAGVGAASAKECLQIQLTRMKENKFIGSNDFNILSQLVAKHMTELGNRQFQKIAQCLKLSVEEVLHYYDILQKLNPIPGNSFSSREKTQYIKPDVTIVKFENYFEVLIDNVNLPKVSVNSYYLNMLKSNPSEEVQDYLEHKYQQVQWIQQSIEERTNTLKKVAMAIVDIQHNFFEKGGNSRVPMSLKDVASTLNLHESTISRAIKNKFLQCTFGIYPMNYFFVKHISGNSSDEMLTAENVKEKIQSIIATEDKKKPLSDQKISEILRKTGADISRRTVAKYRVELMIPNTAGRRESI